jgi:hypothetical protein
MTKNENYPHIEFRFIQTEAMKKMKNYGFDVTLKPLNLKFAEITSNLSLITVELSLPKLLVMWKYTRVGIFDLNLELYFEKWLSEKISVLKTGYFYSITSLTIGGEDVSIVLSTDYQLIFNRFNENTNNESIEFYFDFNLMTDRYTGNLSLSNFYEIPVLRLRLPKDIKLFTTNEFDEYVNYSYNAYIDNEENPKEVSIELRKTDSKDNNCVTNIHWNRNTKQTINSLSISNIYSTVKSFYNKSNETKELAKLVLNIVCPQRDCGSGHQNHVTISCCHNCYKKVNHSLIKY